MEEQGLFGNYKYCEICRRPMPLTYEHNLCPACQEQQLFSEVKEYIRQNDVTEYDVSEHFKISLHRVKQWIREGRIEYKDERINARMTMHCQKCGTPITFGTYCLKCLKQVNTAGYGTATLLEEPTRMRFLEPADNKKKKP